MNIYIYYSDSVPCTHTHTHTHTHTRAHDIESSLEVQWWTFIFVHSTTRLYLQLARSQHIPCKLTNPLCQPDICENSS